LKPQPHPYDRQHLKEVLHKNDLVDEMVMLRNWAKAHLEIVLIGVLVVAAGVYGAYFLVNDHKQKGLNASMLLNEAQGLFQQAGSQPAAQALGIYTQAYAKYQAIASTYEGSSQAKAAQLGMANAELGLGKGADAQQAYAVLDSHDATDPIAALAGLGRARALELQGKASDAASAYAAVLTNYPGSAVEGEAQASEKRLGKAAPKP